MPEIGEIKKALEIGYKRDAKYIWAACPDCGKERWVHLVKGRPYRLRCSSCAGKRRRGAESNHWKGGRVKAANNGIAILLQPDDFFYSMTDKLGYVLEHRLVMAKHLGRNLHPWEIVHHKNHIRDDNHIENLQLIQEMQHNQITLFENRIKKQEEKIKSLEARITLLEAESAVAKLQGAY